MKLDSEINSTSNQNNTKIKRIIKTTQDINTVEHNLPYTNKLGNQNKYDNRTWNKSKVQNRRPTERNELIHSSRN